MKALTIRQPWPWAIFTQGKDIENRDWPTRFRGRIAVHTAKGMTSAEYGDALQFICQARGHFVIPDLEELSRGAIIGTVEIVDCVTKSESPWFMGEYGFVLRNPVLLPEPIPCKGALGFWDVPQELLSKVTVAAAA